MCVPRMEETTSRDFCMHNFSLIMKLGESVRELRNYLRSTWFANLKKASSSSVNFVYKFNRSKRKVIK